MTLLDWLARPRPGFGIRFARQDGWEYWSYERLARLSAQVSASLRTRGLGAQHRIAIVARSDPYFVAALFGALDAGAVAVPLPPPARIGDQSAEADRLARQLEALAPALVIAGVDSQPTLPRSGRLASTTVQDLTSSTRAGSGAGGAAVHANTVGAGLIQFTSGSSGSLRALSIPLAALDANVAAIRAWLGMDGGSPPTVSWLPLYHDMGLIGCLLAPIADQSDLWLMPPEAFVRRPLDYLRCIGSNRAGYSAMPNFGLHHVLTRVRDADLCGLDLSGLRALVLGAEHLDHDLMLAFCRKLERTGLRPEVLAPAYGLAEATLAVTGLTPDKRWSYVNVDTSVVDIGTPARLGEPEAGVLVGCGAPLPCAGVEIRDEAGRTLPAGTVGIISITGQALSTGYVVNQQSSLSYTHFRGSTLTTGDLGFVHDGQLYVLGRQGDSIKVRGRYVFAESLEDALVRHGIAAHHLGVALGRLTGRPAALIAVEHVSAPGPNPSDVANYLRKHASDLSLFYISLPRGKIPRTTSGKIKRRQLWQTLTRDITRLEKIA